MMRKDHLHFEDVEYGFPQNAQGDLFFFPDKIVFLAFPQKGFLQSILAVLTLGLIGFVIRANAMNNWRDQWRGKAPHELVDEFPRSWKLTRQDILGIRHKFIRLYLRTTKTEKPYRLTLGFPQWNEIQKFCKAHGLPLE